MAKKLVGKKCLNGHSKNHKLSGSSPGWSPKLFLISDLKYLNTVPLIKSIMHNKQPTKKPTIANNFGDGLAIAKGGLGASKMEMIGLAF